MGDFLPGTNPNVNVNNSTGENEPSFSLPSPSGDNSTSTEAPPTLSPFILTNGNVTEFFPDPTTSPTTNNDLVDGLVAPSAPPAMNASPITASPTIEEDGGAFPAPSPSPTFESGGGFFPPPTLSPTFDDGGGFFPPPTLSPTFDNGGGFFSPPTISPTFDNGGGFFPYPTLVPTPFDAKDNSKPSPFTPTFPSPFERAPTAAPTIISESDEAKVGLILFIVALVLIFCGWRACASCRRKREKRMLDMRSAQASQVLGDMQMVPNADLDDNELI